ncbi:MAG: efflux RND transporter periplasmic adaptor subunit [Sphaerochaeta sp.]|jgi:multidrug resistance efflux pump|nr:efflux RND transporter periplasmic adaptor subunit [Sphaerochaeta sp.]
MNNPIISPDGDTQDLLNRRKKAKAKARRRKIIVLVVILAIAAAAVFFFLRRKATTSKSATPQATEAQVYTSTYDVSIDVDGYLEANDTQSVYVRTDGTVTGVYVKVGQEVKKGDLLFSVDDTSQQYTLASIQSDIDEAKLSGNQRKLSLLNLQHEAAEKTVEYTKAYANFDGVVASVDIDTGDWFEAGTSVMTIIDRSKLKATVQIDEIDMQYVKLGMEAKLTFDALPGKTITATVSYIPMVGTYTDEGIGVKDVELTIDNPPDELSPGYTFDGTISVEGSVQLVLVPQAAISSTRGVTTVQKKQSDGTVSTVQVSVKYLGEGVSQLVSGDLAVGDTVLLTSSTTETKTTTSLMGMSGGGPGGGGGAPPSGGGGPGR